MTTFNAQEYLEKNLADKSLKKLTFTDLEQKLSGDLIIQDYSQLEEIYLPKQELTSLEIINCPILKRINVRNNQLTKLEIDRSKIGTENQPNPNEISELIAGGNELTALDLSFCPKISKLIIPDNPLLNEIKGLNLVALNNINIANTSVSLNENYEKLRLDKENLLKVIKTLKEGAEEKELVLTEVIQTTEQTEEAIQRHLKKTKKEWRGYFAHPENALPSFQIPESRRKAKEILILISNAITTKNYQELVDKWNDGQDYNAELDFDCSSLDRLIQLLRAQNSLVKKTNKQNLLSSNLEHHEQQRN